MPTQLRFWNELRQWSLVPDASISFAPEPANEVFAGPPSGAPAVPAFRALVAADLPFPFSGGGRLLLPAAAYPGNTFFVATNGADAPISAGGGTAAAPWLTPSFGAAQLASALDFGGQAVTYQAVAGHAAFTSPLNITPWVGGGALTCDLGGGSITTTGADAVWLIGSPPGVPTIQNGTLSTVTSGNCLHDQMAGVVQFQTLTFGACAGDHILVNGGGGRLNCLSSYSITGGAVTHVQVNPTNAVSIEGSVVPGLTLTLTGTPAFTRFAAAVGGDLFIDGVTFSGGATGTRYFINNNGLIFTQNGGPNYLPGNANGSINQPGFYL